MARKSAVLVVVLVVLAGCSGMGGSGSGDAADLQKAQSGDGAGGDGGDGGSGGADGGDAGSGDGSGEASNEQFSADDAEGGGAAASVDRALIKTGSVAVEVENYSAAETAIESRAVALGGYVSASESTLHRSENETWRTGYVEVRVPSSNFTAMFDSSRGQGTVLSADTNTKDVTDKLVDLNARLENLRAQRDRLRSLYESANTTEELLHVQERLSSVQGEIERLEAQKRSLRDQVAFSAPRRTPRAEPEPESPPTGERTPFHEQSPVAVFLSSLAGLVRFARTAFIAGVAALPWVVGLGLPAVLVVRAGRRFGAPSRLPVVGNRPDSGGLPARDDGVVGDVEAPAESERTAATNSDGDEGQASSDGSAATGESGPDESDSDADAEEN
ncbi:DUF4349 domain-containing protein [Halosimplex aquaticum]|uniref:DUF4349 domain-containing protein n=1 Tax=Halosimplex aquaticum TaxID=3026162 RepID=A0ABD5XSZ3_9EURY|nr:DUF4349 domain-containing protein [Halosimplex aquaticum]